MGRGRVVCHETHITTLYTGRTLEMDMSISKTSRELWDAIVENEVFDVECSVDGLTVFDEEGYVIAHGQTVEEAVADFEDRLAEYFVRIVRKYVYSNLPEEGILA